MHTATRLTHYLSELQRDYPSVWEQAEGFRRIRGVQVPDWPDWCYLPLSGAYAIATQGRDDILPCGNDVAIIGALAAWRATQGIYRIHRELFSEIQQTPLEEIPIEVLYQLPEWCIYVDCYEEGGFFAHLEYDTEDGRTELRILVDATDFSSDGMVPFILHLTSPTLEECVRQALVEAERWAQTGRKEFQGLTDELTRRLRPVVALLLYICSAAGERDIKDDRGSDRLPKNPQAKRTKKGVKLFAPPGPTTWDVGWRMGAALGAAKRAYEETADLEQSKGTHASPRPHVRVAHFHHFWTGPHKGERQLVVKWLPPIPVRMDLGDIVPTVRKVQ